MHVNFHLERPYNNNSYVNNNYLHYHNKLLIIELAIKYNYTVYCT